MNDFYKGDSNFVGTKGLVFIGSKVLIYRRDAKAPQYPLHLDVPGGGTEPGETPFETFKREVQEEFGLTITPAHVVYSKRYQSSVSPNQYGWYTVAKLSPEFESKIKFGNEGLGYTLMTPEEFLRRDDAWPAYQQRALEYLQSEQASSKA